MKLIRFFGVCSCLTYVMYPFNSIAQLNSNQKIPTERQIAGFNQVSGNNLGMKKTYLNLINAPAKGYDLSNVELPKSDFLSKLITTKTGAPITCNSLDSFTCSSEDKKKYGISYGDYLKLKLKVSSQIQTITNYTSIEASINNYANNNLASDNRNGGTQLTSAIANNWNEVNNHAQKKLDFRKSQIFSLNNFGTVLNDQFIQSTKMVGSAVATDVDAAKGFGRISLMLQGFNPDRISGIVKGLEINSQLDSLDKITDTIEFVKLVGEIFSDFHDNQQNPQMMAKVVRISEYINAKKIKLGILAVGVDDIARSIKEINDLTILKKELTNSTYKGAIEKVDLDYIQSGIDKNKYDIFFNLATMTKDLLDVAKIQDPGGLIAGISNTIEAANNLRNAAASYTNFANEQELRINYNYLVSQDSYDKIIIDAQIDRINFVSSKVGEYIYNYPISSYSGNLVKQVTSCSTQYNTSHIGSASCSFPIDTYTGFKAADIPVQNEIDQKLPPPPQVTNTYTNGTIVKAPLDIGLTWNQSTKLDLDSHTVTPSGDHVYFLQRGSLTNAPNTFLYRDSIPAGGRLGAEQTRITTFQEGEYRFYVYNFSDQQNLAPAGLSNSSAKVQLFQGGGLLSDIPNDPDVFDLNNPALQKVGQPYPGTNTFNVPTGQSGNAWYVFKLNTRTGILTRVDRFSNVDSSSNIPKFK